MGQRKKLYIAACCILIAGCAGCGEKKQETGYTAESGKTGGSKTENGEIRSISIDLGDAAAVKGSAVLLPVLLAENDGFAGISLDITYDNTLLQFQEIRLSGLFSRYPNAAECTEVPKSNIVRASYVFEEDISETGEFAVLRFGIRKKAETGAAAVNVGIQEAVGIDGKKAAGNEKCVQVSIGKKQQ